MKYRKPVGIPSKAIKVLWVKVEGKWKPLQRSGIPTNPQKYALSKYGTV